MGEPQPDARQEGYSAAFDANSGLEAEQRPQPGDQDQRHHAPKPYGWNTRDLAEVDPQRLLPGRVYRSSQVFNKQAVLELRIRSAIDLRKAGHRARKSAERGEDPKYTKPQPKHPVKSVVGIARRLGSSASSDKSQDTSRAGSASSKPQAAPAGGPAQHFAHTNGDHLAAAGAQSGEPNGQTAEPSPFGHPDQQQGQQQEADGRQQQPDFSTAASRAASAAASISQRRNSRHPNKQDKSRQGGVKQAAGDAAKAAGNAALQAGSTAGHAGAAAGHAAEHVAEELGAPRGDSGFDLAAGRDTLEDYGVQVYHVELLPPRAKLAIFWAVPQRVKWKTVTAALSCSSPQDVMAPVVADPKAHGYTRLYCLMLEKSKPYFRRALAVVSHEENLPCVVHCTHGKDRTGLLSALLLLMCGVDQEAVVQDYMRSEANLKEDRDRVQENAEIGSTMVQDEVIASHSSTMQETLDFLHDKYGNIQGYLKAIKLPEYQQQAIRENLLKPEALRKISQPGGGAAG